MIPSQTKPVEVMTIAKPAPLYHPPLPMELQLVDIDWEVLTPELMAEYLNVRLHVEKNLAKYGINMK